MSKGKSTWKYNKLLTPRRNYFALAGQMNTSNPYDYTSGMHDYRGNPQATQQFVANAAANGNNIDTSKAGSLGPDSMFETKEAGNTGGSTPWGGIAGLAVQATSDLLGIANAKNEVRQRANNLISQAQAALVRNTDSYQSLDDIGMAWKNQAQLIAPTTKQLGAQSTGQVIGNSFAGAARGGAAGAGLGPWGILGGAIGGQLSSLIRSGMINREAKKQQKRVANYIADVNSFNDRSWANAAQNSMNGTMSNLNANYTAFGGELNTQGADFSNGLMFIGNGGSHESNPYEGVLMGMDQEGTPNLVEEGETIFNDYVFSRRLKVPKAIRNKYKLGGKKPISFADASMKLAKESEERPNDPISKRGLEAFMADLAQSQEELKMKQQMREMMNNPELMAQMMTPEETNFAAFGGRVNKFDGRSEATQLINKSKRPYLDDLTTEELHKILPYLDDSDINYDRKLATLLLRYKNDQDFRDGLIDYINNSPTEKERIYRDKSRTYERWYWGNLSDLQLEEALKLINEPYSKYNTEVLFNSASKITNYDSIENNLDKGLHSDLILRYLQEIGNRQYGTDITAPELKKYDEKWDMTDEEIKRDREEYVNRKKKESKEEQIEYEKSQKNSDPKALDKERKEKKKQDEAAKKAADDEAKRIKDEAKKLDDLKKKQDREAKKAQKELDKAARDAAKRQADLQKQQERAAKKAADSDRRAKDASTKAERDEAKRRAKAQRKEEDRLKKEQDRLKKEQDRIKKEQDEFNRLVEQREQEIARKQQDLQQQSYNDALNYKYDLPEVSANDNIDYGMEALQKPVSNTRSRVIDSLRKAGYTDDEIDYLDNQKGYNGSFIPSSQNDSFKHFFNKEDGFFINPVTGELNSALKYAIDKDLKEYREGPGEKLISMGYTPEEVKYIIDKEFSGVKIPLEEYSREELDALAQEYRDSLPKERAVTDKYGRNLGTATPFTGTSDTPVDIGDTTVVEDPERNVYRSQKGLPTWMRYASVLGAAIGVGTDLFGLTNKPDYSEADALSNFAAGSTGSYQPVSYNPIGNYLTYRPFDQQYNINNLNAQSAANRRALLQNAGLNRGAGMSALLAADYNAQNSIGNAYRQAAAYNEEQKKNIEEFNRGTNIQNSEGFLKADVANQEARLKGWQANADLRAKAAEMRQKERLMASEGRAANLTNLFQGIGDIGYENFNMNMANSVSPYYRIGSNGQTTYTNEYFNLSPQERAKVDEEFSKKYISPQVGKPNPTPTVKVGARGGLLTVKSRKRKK